MGELRIVGVAVMLIAALTACDSSAEGSAPSAQSGTPVSKGCQLPVTFDVAEKWVPKQVTDAGSLGEQGDFLLACEIDAKPAGHLGFLRVWTTDEPGDARAALDRFLADDKNITVPEYSSPQVAGTTAAEVTYVRDNPTAEIKKRERALVIPTSKGSVLLHLGGLDDEEHNAMLPAFDLAKKTMKQP